MRWRWSWLRWWVKVVVQRRKVVVTKEKGRVKEVVVMEGEVAEMVGEGGGDRGGRGGR